jgi:hypothetical protein
MEAKALVDGGGYMPHTTCLLQEQSISFRRGVARVPDMSFVWIRIILHAIGGEAWAETFVHALPSVDAMWNDGAPRDWRIGQLVDDVGKVIFEHKLVLLTRDDIQNVNGMVYFCKTFQEKLMGRLRGEASFVGVQAWMQARFERARITQQVHLPMVCST